MLSQTFAYDEAKALTTNAFVKSYTVNYLDSYFYENNKEEIVNYTFAGWATEENGAVVYTDAQSVKNLTKTLELLLAQALP